MSHEEKGHQATPSRADSAKVGVRGPLFSGRRSSASGYGFILAATMPIQ
jgi:hypothetical protein